MSNPIEDGLNHACMDVTLTENFGAYVTACMSGTVKREVLFGAAPLREHNPLGPWTVSVFTDHAPDKADGRWEDAHIKMEMSLEDAEALGAYISRRTILARQEAERSNDEGWMVRR